MKENTHGYGLMVGKIVKTDNDPDNQSRILIEVPELNSSDGVWARVTKQCATSNNRLKIGDDVVLGFLNQDLRFPIILGSLS